MLKLILFIYTFTVKYDNHNNTNNNTNISVTLTTTITTKKVGMVFKKSNSSGDKHDKDKNSGYNNWKKEQKR